MTIFRMVDLIACKRDGGELASDALHWFARHYAQGDIPDYQAAALLMAIYLRGLNTAETTALTLALAQSGDVMALQAALPNQIVVDKHSTGGVGDKTSLVIAPVVAACGVAVGKMSGRGLGFTGGTLDKLECFPGYQVQLSIAEFLQQLQTIGIVLAGQSVRLAPADGKLYALRDATATVNAIPLIAASVMSKKLAAGAQAIVLDIKVGSGAFMADLEHARMLALQMLAIGQQAGRRVVAVLSDMSQPLGNAVGNSLEVQEAIATLHGNGPTDFSAHCLTIAAYLLLLAQRVPDVASGRAMAKAAIQSGAAFTKFVQLIAAQGGDSRYAEQPERFPQAALQQPVLATQAGYLAQLDARAFGEAALLLGAGRVVKEASIDRRVGFICHKKIGERVAPGDSLYTIHASDSDSLALAQERLQTAIQIISQPVLPPPGILQVLGAD